MVVPLAAMARGVAAAAAMNYSRVRASIDSGKITCSRLIYSQAHELGPVLVHDGAAQEDLTQASNCLQFGLTARS